MTQQYSWHVDKFGGTNFHWLSVCRKVRCPDLWLLAVWLSPVWLSPVWLSTVRLSPVWRQTYIYIYIYFFFVLERRRNYFLPHFFVCANLVCRFVLFSMSLWKAAVFCLFAFVCCWPLTVGFLTVGWLTVGCHLLFLAVICELFTFCRTLLQYSDLLLAVLFDWVISDISLLMESNITKYYGHPNPPICLSISVCSFPCNKCQIFECDILPAVFHMDGYFFCSVPLWLFWGKLNCDTKYYTIHPSHYTLHASHFTLHTSHSLLHTSH